MLDTIVLQSKTVPETLARAVEGWLERRTCVDLRTGEVKWEFTSGGLEGTWDHRVSVRVERRKWVKPQDASIPELQPCKPYLKVECSVHKALLGHNVEGGPDDVEAPMRWLLDRLAQLMDLQLPAADTWAVKRLDWAEVYDLGSYEAVEEYIGYLRNAEFARRKKYSYGFEGVMVAGSTTSVKLYHKGPEFQQHDRKRIKKHGDVLGLQVRANMLLRCEVEIHTIALESNYGCPPGPADIEREWVTHIHDREMARLVREGTGPVDRVRTFAAVKRRLFEVYSAKQARTLLGTWMQLSAIGEDAAKASLTRPTFYRHRKQLVDAGCSWHGSDVHLDDSIRLVPENFAPLRSDPRRVTHEAPEVSAALAPYRIAS